MIKVLIYEDNILYRDNLVALISGSKNHEVLGAYEEGGKIAEEVLICQPDVVLLDSHLSDISGIEALKLLRTVNSSAKVLMLTVFEDDKNIFEAIRLGAHGYLLKKTPTVQLLRYISEVVQVGALMTSTIAYQILELFRHENSPKRSSCPLSEIEYSILQHLVQGFSYKMIAAEMDISIHAIRAHVGRMYEKLQERRMVGDSR
jgi:DNA-binding NarL/FixJ family response regulator